MIKNILYSLLLHSTFAFLIYANFRHITHDTIDLKDGLIVGVVDWSSLTAPNKIVAKTEVAETKPEIVEKKSETKPEKKEKPKPKLKPKKHTKKVKKESPPNPISENKAKLKKNDEEKIKKIEEEKPQEKEEKSEEEKPDENKKEEENKEDKNTDKANAKETELVTANVSNTQNLENLQLSAREKFNIQTQLKACYSRALADVPKSNLVAMIKVVVLEDGTISFDEDKIIDIDRYNNPKETDYKNRMDSVIIALELCSPLRNMPADKYEIWREFTIEFGGE